MTKTKRRQVSIVHEHRTMVEALQRAKHLVAARILMTSRNSHVTLQRHYQLVVVHSFLGIKHFSLIMLDLNRFMATEIGMI